MSPRTRTSHGLSVPELVPLSQLAARCERFTQEFVWGTAPVTVTVELLSPELGDQILLRDAAVRAITFDPRDAVLEVSLEDGNHRVSGIQQAWLAEEAGGNVELLEAVRGDGGKEILTFSRVRHREPRTFLPRTTIEGTGR